MFDAGSDDAARGMRLRGARDGEVVRFGAAAGEDDLARVGAEELRHRGARLFERAACALAAMMDRGGVRRIRIAQAGDCGAHRGPQRRAGVIVEINAHTGLIGPRRTNNLAYRVGGQKSVARPAIDGQASGYRDWRGSGGMQPGPASCSTGRASDRVRTRRSCVIRELGALWSAAQDALYVRARGRARVEEPRLLRPLGRDGRTRRRRTRLRFRAHRLRNRGWTAQPRAAAREYRDAARARRRYRGGRAR